MKRHLKFRILFLFFLCQFVIAKKSNATAININVTTIDTIATCKENHFKATYISPGNHGISIKAFLTLTGGNTNTFCDNNSNLYPNVYIIVDSIKKASMTNPHTDTIGHNCIWRDSLLSLAK